jgi:hypothetical protein
MQFAFLHKEVPAARAWRETYLIADEMKHTVLYVLYILTVLCVEQSGLLFSFTLALARLLVIKRFFKRRSPQSNDDAPEILPRRGRWAV